MGSSASLSTVMALDADGLKSDNTPTRRVPAYLVPRLPSAQSSKSSVGRGVVTSLRTVGDFNSNVPISAGSSKSPSKSSFPDSNCDGFSEPLSRGANSAGSGDGVLAIFRRIDNFRDVVSGISISSDQSSLLTGRPFRDDVPRRFIVPPISAEEGVSFGIGMPALSARLKAPSMSSVDNSNC